MLSMFDSDTIVNRKSDEPLLIKDPFMSIIGSIQPSVLVDTFGNDNMMNNGFNQRWLFCYPESGCPRCIMMSPYQSVISDRKDFIYNLIMYDFRSWAARYTRARRRECTSTITTVSR